MPKLVIDAELAQFLDSGVSILAATRSAALDPHVTRASALRVLAASRILLLLPRATSAASIANLRDNGDVAVCATSARNYRSVQLKGRCVAIGDATADEVAHGAEQLRGLGAVLTGYGWTRQHVRNLWMADAWRIEVEVVEAYTQTPGPGAGAQVPTP